ncbi:MAG: hypothetical protein WB474_11870 [Nitrososphaeraceae archaeon]
MVMARPFWQRGYFGSVSTLAKPVLSTVNTIVISSFVYLIAGFTFTPLAQQVRFTKQTRRYYFLILTSAILGATIAPVMFFLDLSILLLPTHLFWPMEKRYFQYCLHSLSSKRE